MKNAGLWSRIPADVWKIDWTVNSQVMGSGEASIKSLAPYVFKVAISDHRIDRVEGRNVFIRYEKTGSNRLRTMKLDVISTCSLAHGGRYNPKG